MKKEAKSLFMELGLGIESNSRLIMVAVDEYLSSKKYEDAVIVFSQLLKADPENPTLNFFTGMAYEAVEDFKKAIFYYLKIKPDHSQYKKTILNIALLYKQLGEEKTATNYLEDKYRLFPKDIDIIIYLASFYEKDKDYEKAITLLEKGLEDSPGNTSLLFRLGMIQDKAGLKEQSIRTMKTIIEIDPKDSGALNYLGYTYADQGIKLDEALLLLKRAYELRPDDGYVTDSLGWVYYKMGDYQKAVEYLKKAAELTSFETIISDHLGDAYQKANQLGKAINTYKKALSNAKEDDKETVLELKKKIDAVQKQINE
jgi:tetratricopeptide (TPR) repeat protein